MTVVFDYQAFFQTVGGVSRCFVELMKHLGPECAPSLAIRTTENKFLLSSGLLQNADPIHLTEANYLPCGRFKGRSTLFRHLSRIPAFPSFDNINSKFARQFLAENEYDVFHPTFYGSYYEGYLKKVPVVTTIHDMTWEQFPEKGMDIWSRKKYQQALRADKIIAVSENTKKDIIRIWDIPEEKIDVVYHGCPERPGTSNCAHPIGGRPYFLFVGRRNDYKDFATAARAFSEFVKENRDYILVCIGSDFSKDEKRMFDSLGISDKVIVSMVNDIELANFYSHASALLFTSLYEGFGIPVTEAMTFGCPMILSRASCFPEIAADVALYFKPSDEYDMLARMNEISEMSAEELDAVKRKGMERASNFSWSKSARKLESIYKSL